MTMEKEIMPLGLNVFVQPYLENPYKQVISKGGLQLTNGEFQNQDSGEVEKLTADICCGLVLEVGKDCKEVKVGDEVFFSLGRALPIPFMGKGFMLTHEPGLLCIINEGLKERFNK
jgi:co-chaperonin GroES (HSP10)